MKTTTKQTLKFYWKHLQCARNWAILNELGVVMGVATGMGFAIIAKLMIDTMTGATSAEAVAPTLFTLLGGILVLEILHNISWRLAGYSACTMQPRVMVRIMDECFSALHKHSYKFFNDNFTGALVKKVNRISRAFERVADQITFEFTPLVVRTTLSIAVLSYLNVWMGLILIGWTLFFILSNTVFSIYKLKRYDLPAVQADSAVTAQLADTITNHNNIKLFANQRFEDKKFRMVSKDWLQKTKQSWFFSQHAEVVQSIVMVALNVGVLYLAIELWKDGKLTIGDFALVQIYLGQLFQQLWTFGRNIRDFYENMADAEEMTEILELPIEVQDAEAATELVVRHGGIEFKDVNFSYDGQNDIIKKLQLRIKPGEKVALIGPSGGGKSTITKLLLRLFDIQEGAIEIDGQNIAQATQESLRSSIALVPQDPVLFHRTLMENIRYGCLDASDEAVIAAAKMAHCHEFIQTFPEGYDTYVGERGVKLSGGERQRIAIARALLSNAKILILDEATSNLDSESEQLIQDALEKLTRNKTTLVIAHRLSTIVKMDRIIVLNKGEIVEEGSHGELIRKEDSLYKKLWNLQIEGYLE